MRNRGDVCHHEEGEEEEEGLFSNIGGKQKTELVNVTLQRATNLHIANFNESGFRNTHPLNRTFFFFKHSNSGVSFNLWKINIAVSG